MFDHKDLSSISVGECYAVWKMIINLPGPRLVGTWNEWLYDWGLISLKTLQSYRDPKEL